MALVCCCSLAGTMACRVCPEYIRHFGEQPNNVTISWPPFNPVTPIQPLVTPKKVVEEYEYDKQGRMIKKTITESTT